MEKNRKKQIVVLSIALVCIFILVFSLFHKSATKDSANPPLTNVLTDSISQIVSACPGEIGVAVIVNNRDTVKVNNKSVYPMMSVFKVHQALALCNDFDNKGISLDTLVNINRDKLDPKTWSPMLKDYSGPVISLTVRDLLRYTLTQSDNNASNLMFKDMVNVAQTDSFIATFIPRSSFQIAYTEEEMSADHNKAYSNYTSPLGAAMLMNRLFTEGLIDDEKQSFIKNTLKECKTGVDRIAAPLLDKEGVVIAHKTGSGYVNENGVLAAHNDVAYICMPNNVCYTFGKQTVHQHCGTKRRCIIKVSPIVVSRHFLFCISNLMFKDMVNVAQTDSFIATLIPRSSYNRKKRQYKSTLIVTKCFYIV